MTKAPYYMTKYFWQKTTIVLALSWGPDSMFLLSLLRSYRDEKQLPNDHLVVCTINHKTRPETDQEVAFLQDYCKDYPFECIDYQGTDFSERALRNFRYQSLYNVYKKYKADFLVLWHHLNDRVESFMLHMRRGASLNGMRGMQIVQPSWFSADMTLFRPLLTTTREEILTQVTNKKIPHFMDPTNVDPTISQRNKLRNDIMPWLLNEEQQPTNFLSSMQQLFDYLDQPSSSITPFLLKLKPSDYWNAQWYYKRQNKEQNITLDHIVALLKQTNTYKNISHANLREIHKFLTHSTSGYKFFNGVYRFIAHGAVYLIKAPHDFRKVTPQQSAFAQATDLVRSKSRSKYCIAQKIPIFRRNFIKVTKSWNQITKVFLEGVEY